MGMVHFSGDMGLCRSYSWNIKCQAWQAWVGSEWALNTGASQDIRAEYPELTTELFATRLNHKICTYRSWKPDPGCSFVDAFSKIGILLIFMNSHPSAWSHDAFRKWQGNRNSHCPVMAQPTMVSYSSPAYIIIIIIITLLSLNLL